MTELKIEIAKGARSINTSKSMKAEYDFSKGKRGPVVPPRPGTALIRFHVDDEILDWFQEQMNQAGGGDFTELMNDVLRDYVRRQPSPARVS